jgi:hypothetical protein
VTVVIFTALSSAKESVASSLILCTYLIFIDDTHDITKDGEKVSVLLLFFTQNVPNICSYVERKE